MVILRAAALLVVLAMCCVLPAAAVAEPPSIAVTRTGPLGSGGWYVGDVSVTWQITPSSGYSSTGCDGRVLTADTAGTAITCTATIGLDSASSTTVVRIDRTPPQALTLSTDRPPDHDGWFTRPLTAAFAGVDATSGIESCTHVSYAGPDNDAATLSGSCRDAAGNTSAPLAFALRYDATPPAAPLLTASAGDAGVTLGWRSSPDTARVVLTRALNTPGAAATTLYDGTAQGYADGGLANGVALAYTLTAFDAAGNASQATAGAIPAAAPIAQPAALPAVLQLPALTSKPPAARRIAAPPRLRWARVRNARYYNVQLYRGAVKMLSSWPRGPALQLHHRWRYGGRSRTLRPGTYRWYVWPGYGRLGARRYGHLLGRGSFVLRR